MIMARPRRRALATVVLAALICRAAALSKPALLQQHVLARNATAATGGELLPVVLWHGMGDSCCDAHSIGAVRDHVEALLPGTFVHSLSTGAPGAGEISDVWSSYFGSVDRQVERACQELRSLPALAQGYVAVGFSQGGQFMRAVVQRCQHLGPRCHTLVTMGSQHQGIMDIPGCWQPSFNATPTWGCRLMQRLLGAGAYLEWVQAASVQAQYFKDPANLDLYHSRSAFLADINAESARAPAPAHYRANLASLRRLVLFAFQNDVTVVPKESAWFSFFDGERLVLLNETRLYAEDRIGLRELDEGGKLLLESAPGFHMQFTLDWFGRHVVEPYLKVPAAHAERPRSHSGSLAAAAAVAD